MRCNAGFTLVQLLMVSIIMVIIAAMAIPTFRRQRQKAQEETTEPLVRNAMTAMETLYVDDRDFS